MVVMRSGRVLQRGLVSEVLSSPADSYVEQLCSGLTGIAS
jgi:ABC-type proline/glycine betaine transport system ATPase subunit